MSLIVSHFALNLTVVLSIVVLCLLRYYKAYYNNVTTYICIYKIALFERNKEKPFYTERKLSRLNKLYKIQNSVQMPVLAHLLYITVRRFKPCRRQSAVQEIVDVHRERINK